MTERRPALASPRVAELTGLVAKAVGATSSEGCLVMVARSNGQAIIFLPCGFFYLLLLLLPFFLA